MERVAVILAGGEGERLRPITYAVNKHLLPVYDKSMLLLSIEFCEAVGVSRIVIVTGKQSILTFCELLRRARPEREFYVIEQNDDKGIASALRSAKELTLGKPLFVVLADNLFHGDRFVRAARALSDLQSTHAGCLAVSDPRAAKDSCVVTFNEYNKVVGLEEKPLEPQSDWIAVGAYVYPPDVYDIIDTMQPSARGEYEITDVNKSYLTKNHFHVKRVATGDGNLWFDLGTPDNLLKAGMLRYASDNR